MTLALRRAPYSSLPAAPSIAATVESVHQMAEVPSQFLGRTRASSYERTSNAEETTDDDSFKDITPAPKIAATAQTVVPRHEALKIETTEVKPKRRGFFGRLIHDVATALDDLIGMVDEVLEDDEPASTVVASSIKPAGSSSASSSSQSGVLDVASSPIGSSSSQGKACHVKVDNVKVTMASKTCRQQATSTHDVELAVPTCPAV